MRWDLDDEADDEVGLVPTDDTTFRMVFRAVPVAETARNRMHLDLTTTSLDDQRASVARLVDLGARHLDIGQGRDVDHVVLADPEGNELCLIEPGNAFLDGCGRLGALACDGSQAVGRFWSHALGWPLVWDQDDETAIGAPGGAGPFITWDGGPLEPKVGRNRLRLELAPSHPSDLQAEVDRLVSLGAAALNLGQVSVGWTEMSDPDGNEFRLSSEPEHAPRRTARR